MCCVLFVLYFLVNALGWAAGVEWSAPESCGDCEMRWHPYAWPVTVGRDGRGCSKLKVTAAAGPRDRALQVQVGQRPVRLQGHM